MADPKKNEAATEPAPHAVGEVVSDTPSSTGPIVDPDGDTSPNKTYYLREGKEHHVLVKGEARVLTQVGDKAELTDAQYQQFKDKFYTAEEYKGVKAHREALAAEQVTDAARMEQATPEAHAAGEAQLEGKGAAATQSSAGGKPETK